MIEQQGQLVEYRDGRATVRIGAQSGCPACDAGRGCGAGLFNRLIVKRPFTIELTTTERPTVGEAVTVGVPAAAFLRLVAVTYLVPLLAGLVLAFVGHYLVTEIERGSIWLRDLGALAGALVGATVAVAASRKFSVGSAENVKIAFVRAGGSESGSNCRIEAVSGNRPSMDEV